MHRIARFFSAFALAVAVGNPALAAEEIFPLDSVKAGLRAEGRTTFAGDATETFEVEIVGVLRRAGPKRSLILARVSGAEAIARGRVYAGMSGSPIYADGKLLGALSSTWAFATEAIAGITPAEEMVALYERAAPVLAPLHGGVAATTAGFSSAAPIYTLDDFLSRKPLRLEDALRRLSPRTAPGDGADDEALLMPLVFGGFGARFVAETADSWRAAGFVPVQGAKSGVSDAPSHRLIPGMPVGVQLMRGDLEIAATGTLTHRAGDKILAFGHSFLGLGTTPMPLVAARVEALVPRSHISLRMASTGATLGAVVRDSEVGIVGALGCEAPMVPVRLAITLPDGKTETFSYEVISHPLLTPALAAVGLRGALESFEQAAGPQTFEVDGVIALQGYPDVRIRDLIASEAGGAEPAFLLSAYLGVLYNSGLAAPVVERVELSLGVENRLRSAFLTGARAPRAKVRAGETIPLTVGLRPHQEGSRVIEADVHVPAHLKGRSVALFVSDAMTLTRLEAPRRDYFPSGLEELIHILNGLRDNRRLYIHLVEWKPSYVVNGRLLPNLPSDIRALHRSPASPGGSRDIPVTYLTTQTLDTDYHLRGFFQIPLEVQ